MHANLLGVPCGGAAWGSRGARQLLEQALACDRREPQPPYGYSKGHKIMNFVG